MCLVFPPKITLIIIFPITLFQPFIMFFTTKFLSTVALIVCFAFSSFAQNHVEHWSNGNRKAETQFSQEFSYTTQWHENGTKLSEGTVRYEKRIGTWRFWHENGKQQFVMFYDSLATDLIKASAEGIIVRITTYDKNGVLERVENYSDALPFVYSDYYPNGQLRQIVNYEKGVPNNGIRWFENGSINEMFSFQKVYKTDNVAGKDVTKVETEKLTYKEWYDSGKMLLDGQVNTKGQREGIWHQYDKYGNVIQTIEN
jgi:antitoxin component YwqK of YwqJK toxin-antitoxin module